jgi:hypothetical protein
MKIEECAGYAKLKAAVEKDPFNDGNDYAGKLKWIIDRAEHYAEKTGLEASEILDAWEKNRGYWYMNYYQECNQPLLDGYKIRVFETLDDMFDSLGNLGFRCPACNGISKIPYECDSGLEMSEGNICDWKVYGLFTDMGKGIYVFVKDKCAGVRLFMPVAWE